MAPVRGEAHHFATERRVRCSPRLQNAVTTIANLTTLNMLIDHNPFTVFPRVRSGSEAFANRVRCISPLSFVGGRYEPLGIKVDETAPGPL